MPKVLRSNHRFEMKFRFPQGRETLEILLPKARYKNWQHQAGRTHFIELSDEQVALLESNATFASLLRHGSYSWVREIPAHALPPLMRLKAEKERADRAEAELAELKAGKAVEA